MRAVEVAELLVVQGRRALGQIELHALRQARRALLGGTAATSAVDEVLRAPGRRRRAPPRRSQSGRSAGNSPAARATTSNAPFASPSFPRARRRGGRRARADRRAPRSSR